MKLYPLLLSILLIVLVLTGTVLPSQAATIYAAPGGATSGLCGSWTDACELSYALVSAVSGQDIWVKAGTYTPTDTGRSATFQLKSGVAIYGGFTGTETDLSQRNWTTNVTVLSGSATNSYHVVTGANNAILDGVTVTGGNADGTGFNNFGGGMYNDGSSPTLNNCTFSGNRTTGAGAGIYNNSNSPVLTNCTFSNNQNNYKGGGIFNNYSNPTFANCTFSGNMASFGGGIYNYQSNPTLTDCIFSGNLAPTGGAMYDDLSNTTLTNCTLSGNNAMSGGAMYLNATSPVLTNCTLSGNSAGSGGGIYNSGGGPTLINCTLSGNSASSGGGIYNFYGFPTIRNSILWGDSSAEFYNNSPFPLTISDSLVQGGSGNDPLLAPLGNYGGATQTIPLLPGSSAINAGNGAYCPATDQRGVARPQGSACDIGAFESRGFILTKTGGDNQSTSINNSFADPLTVSVTAKSAGEPVNGGLVTFTAPVAGASLDPVTSSAIIAAGTVSRSIAANNTSGSYSVSALAAGADPLSFSLINAIAPPTAIAATAITSTGFNANWISSTGATGYYLDVATDSGFSSFVSGYQNKDVGNFTTFAVSTLAPGTSYHYRVRAYDSSAPSSYSNTVNQATQPGQVESIVVDPSAPARLYATVAGSGVFISTGNGTTWSAAATQPDNLKIKRLVIHPVTRSTLFAASYGSGMYKSTDSGNVWTTCANTNLSGAALNAVSLAIDPSGALYAGTEAGIYTSSDCTSWVAVNSGLIVDASKPPVAIAVDPANTAKLYAGLDGAGIFRSIDSGANWSPATIQPANLRIRALAFKPGESTNLYAASYGNGLFKSLDSGVTWDSCTNTNLTNLNMLSLTIDASGKLYAGSEAGVFVSSDGCVSWTAINGGLP